MTTYNLISTYTEEISIFQWMPDKEKIELSAVLCIHQTKSDFVITVLTEKVRTILASINHNAKLHYYQKLTQIPLAKNSYRLFDPCNVK